MMRTTRALASVALPAMSLVAAAAPQLIGFCFGPAWEPAVRIVQVLAIAGAVQAIYQPSTVPLILGLGHAKLALRLSLLYNAVFIAGIVVGIPYSPLAVAVGYTVATLTLVPVDWWVRRHLLGLTLASQARTFVPGVHVSLWMAAAYSVVATVLDQHDLAALALGGAIAVAVGLAVLRRAHPAQFSELVHIATRVLGRPQPKFAGVESIG